jgi:hypothetical protein
VKPENVNILGTDYTIDYKDNPSDVDIHKRKSLWGQIDYWTRTIRIYDSGKPETDVFHSILHEVLHGIDSALNLHILDKEEIKDGEEVIDMLALALSDVFYRNGWINLEDSDKDE